MKSGGLCIVLVAIGLAVYAGPSSAQQPSTITVYSSLPLVGDSRPHAEDVVRAERLALEEADGQAGPYAVRFVSLNNGTSDTGTWDPGRTSFGARRAAEDPGAVAYLGEFNTGASAVSIPILNEVGILQISPVNTYVGLTRSEGVCCGEPDRYYPLGTRHYARLTPPDHLQARAMVDYLERRRVRRAFIVDDGEVYGGAALAALIRKRLSRGGVVSAGRGRLRRRGANAAAIARRVRARRADAMVFTGITQNGAVRLWSEVSRRNPGLKLFGADGVADSAFTRQIPKRAAKRTRITSPALAPDAYPLTGQAFFAAFRSRYGRQPYPFGIAGYEAMRLTLDAIRQAGPQPDVTALRAAVIRAVFATRERASPLGTYSIDENGDTTLGTYGGYSVGRDGNLRFDRVLRTAG
jgi:branched-chain amino acid transport system substrate-binding protein